jgi:hypothetical protein
MRIRPLPPIVNALIAWTAGIAVGAVFFCATMLALLFGTAEASIALIFAGACSIPLVTMLVARRLNREHAGQGRRG